MKYITGWESGWRNLPILWEKYEYQLPRLSPGFCYIFSCYGKLMGKTIISYMLKYTIGWKFNGKKHKYYGKIMGKYYGKIMGTNFPGFAHLMVFAEFSHAVGN